MNLPVSRRAAIERWPRALVKLRGGQSTESFIFANSPARAKWWHSLCKSCPDERISLSRLRAREAISWEPIVLGLKGMRRAWIKIDLDRLTLRLRVSLGRPFSEWEVHQWLQRAGFHWISGTWFISDIGTAVLMPDEIVVRQIRETTDGITFIEPETTDPSGPHAP